MVGNDLQDRGPGLARGRAKAGLVEGARLLHKGVALRGQRNCAPKMGKRSRKIARGARDAAGQQPRRSVVGTRMDAVLDMKPCGCDIPLRKQHRRQQMAQHRLARAARQPLFAQIARLVGPPCIEGSGGSADDVLG